MFKMLVYLPLSTCRYMIKEPGYDFSRLSSEVAPTFLLSFEYRGQNTFFNFLVPEEVRDTIQPGVAHSDELQYLFYTGLFNLSEDYD